MALTPAERARLDALRQARDGGERFAAFVHRMSPQLGAMVPRHLRRLYELAEASRRGAVWVRVSMPPRLGKSTTLVQQVGWRLLRDPSVPHFYITFADDLATSFSYAARRLAIQSGTPLAPDRKNVHDWQTAFGGGLKATTMGGQITGRGTEDGLILVDDLIKGREAAESLTVRDKAWSFFTDDVLTRRDTDRVPVWMIGTRWHPDDPIGRTLKNDLGRQWQDVKLAAVVDARTGEPVDGGDRGQDFDPDIHVPIWPERGKDLEWARQERCAGAYRWWSLFQQEPRSADSKVFEKAPLRFNLDEFNPDGWRLHMVADPAGTSKTSSDYWSIGVIAVRGYGDECEGRILARIHEQAQLSGVLAKVRRLRERFPIPLNVEGVGGFAMIPDAIRMVDPSMPVRLIPSHIVNMSGGKRARAIGYAEAWNAGRFRVPEGAEWDGYIDEHLEFTGLGDAHDDDVDMSAYGWRLGWRPRPQMVTGGIIGAGP